MLLTEGPTKCVFEDGVIRNAVDWSKNLIPVLLVTDAGEFYIKSTHGALGSFI